MQRKRVLLIAYHCLSQDSTGGLRPNGMAKYLPQYGVDITLVTYCAQRDAIVFNENVVAVRDLTRETIPLAIYYLWRMWLHVLQFFGLYVGIHSHWRNEILRNSDKIIDLYKPDAVLVTYPPIEALEVGIALADKYAIPLIVDFRDGLLFEPLEEKILLHGAVRRHYSFVECKVIQLAHLVLSVSEPISAYLRRCYTHTNVMTLPNGFDPDDVVSDAPVSLSIEKVNFVHTGRLGASRIHTTGKGCGVDALATALIVLLDSQPDIVSKAHFHFVGSLLKDEIKTLAPLVERGVVTLWGHVSRSKALKLQRNATILLLITAPDKASVATGKLFEYLAAAKPILALTRGTEAARIIQEAGVGLIAAPDNPREIADTIEMILLNPKHLYAPLNEVISLFSRERQMCELAARIWQIDQP